MQLRPNAKTIFVIIVDMKAYVLKIKQTYGNEKVSPFQIQY